MRRMTRVITDSIMREYRKKKKYQELREKEKKKAETIKRIKKEIESERENGNR